jgi:hypothetical protein
MDREAEIRIRAFVRNPTVVHQSVGNLLARGDWEKPREPSMMTSVHYKKKSDTSCKTEPSSSCGRDDNEESADEMTWQGQGSGHIPASVVLKRCSTWPLAR